MYPTWIVQIPNSAVHGNGGKWYQFLSLKNYYHYSQNTVQVQFLGKYQEHHQLDFWNLCQKCHIIVQYLIRFLLWRHPQGVDLTWNSQNVKKIYPLEVCRKGNNCVILMIAVYPLKLNKYQDLWKLWVVCTTFAEGRG